ncbi:hypothetical protein [Roseovarius nanhaiticus]|uniref:Lipoprotein n=1 Tax=Roseovarius nanhaiticus TaxID=573024 RepID=A0A1N7G7C4_9RHOB|nr:hypothetical protein [Roseovarius nanhaiticus]SEK35134.1 hypothetical protein SAMN05216208_0391 [Roseovarius nanhaiticus]SIS08513.1 hypothetical protein SAMN05421666_1745 [Roseovarius nanhaiticus]
MRSLVTIATISSLALAGCSGFRDSRANPANWFGGSRTAPAPTAAEASVNPLIPEERRNSIFQRKSDEETYEGTPIYAVEKVEIERSSGGAIIKATGLSLRQGAFDVRLQPENGGEPVNGVLTYTLRAVQRADTPQGPEQTRRVEAGQFISSQALAEASEIRVLARTNSAASRR